MNSASKGAQCVVRPSTTTLRMCSAVLALAVLAGCSNDRSRAEEATARGTQFAKAQQRVAASQALFKAVEADPDYRPAHDALVKLWLEQKVRLTFKPAAEHPEAKKIQGEIDAKYARWVVDFPKSIEVLRAYGVLLQVKSDPRAFDVLSKVVAHDPKDVEIWRRLTRLAELKGDLVKSSELAHKTALLDPTDANDQYYYVASLYQIDKAKWRSESFDLARRFPNDERGAQALYWVGMKGGGDDETQISALEQLVRSYSPQKFHWATSGTRPLFDLYLRSKNPKRAAELATAMAKNPSPDPDEDPENSVEAWQGRARLATAYIAVTDKLQAGDIRGARALIDEIPVDPRAGNVSMLIRIKAQLLAVAGNIKEAYAMLLGSAYKEPIAENLSALQSIGKQIGKTDEQIERDLAGARIAQSGPPPEFGLRDFYTSQPVSLSAYRGKVILVSFWYPNCGPCRAEMPHIDGVVRDLQNPELVYLAPNGYPDEDALAGPFVKKMGYAFTPMKVASKHDIMDPKGPNIQAFPANFLIDREGRVAYRDFMVGNAEAEALLKARIEALLRDKAGS